MSSHCRRFVSYSAGVSDKQCGKTITTFQISPTTVNLIARTVSLGRYQRRTVSDKCCRNQPKTDICCLPRYSIAIAMPRCSKWSFNKVDNGILGLLYVGRGSEKNCFHFFSAFFA